MDDLIKYILIAIIACFAVGAAVAAFVIRAALNKRRDAINGQAEKIAENEKTIADLREAIASVEESLRSEQSDNGCRRELISRLSAGCKGRSGKVSLYVFEGSGEKRLYPEAGSEKAEDILTEHGAITLYEALEAAAAEGAAVVKEGVRLTVEYTAEGEKQIYLVTDITDNFTAEKVTEERDELAARLECSDIFTNAIKLESFLEKNAGAFERSPEKDLWLLYMRTEPSVLPDEIMSNFDEAYLKMCSERLAARFGETSVTRCSRFGLCALMHAESEEAALAIAEAVSEEIENERSELWPIDQRFKNRSVYELAYYDGSNLEDFIYCMRIRARVDMQRSNIGIHMFYASELPRILGYKTSIEDATKRKKINFTYQPVIYASNAKVFAYEMTPYFPSLSFSSTDEMIYRARLFGLSDELEDMLFEQALKKYDKAIKTFKMLPGIKVLIKSFPGACMLRKEEDDFRAKNYDLLPNLIVEFSEQLPENEIVAEIKCGRLSEWGGWSTVRVDQNSEKNGMKMGVYKPQLVRISASLLETDKYVQRIKDVISRLHGQNVLALIDEITKPQHIDLAIRVGADLLQGEYVSRAADAPGEAADKCIRRIAQLRFRKR